MEEKIKFKINASGLKKKHLAKRLQITPNYLSMCISGKRNLSETKQTELKNLLDA